MSYVELHCHSYYSFLNGASSPQELAERAEKLEMPSLAITDQDGLYGVIPFYHACRKLDRKPILGAEITVEQGDSIRLLCKTMQGYRNLSHLITKAHRGRPKGEPMLSLEHLAESTQGLICLVGGKEGRFAELLKQDQQDEAANYLRTYCDLFDSEHLYVELTRNLDQWDVPLCARSYRLAQDNELPCVATNGVHYAEPRQGCLHDLLRCIKHHVTLDQSHHLRPGNHERCLKGETAMKRLFHEIPEVLANTVHIAERCEVDLDFSEYRFPSFPVPDGMTPDAYLVAICQEKIPQKYAPVNETVRQRLREELDLIQRLGLSGYFLTVWDIVEFAHRRGVPVQGRGSAANSLVAYLLNITPVDPIAHHLFLGRFLNEERTTIPDIDLDFAASREEGLFDREDVIQYVYERYGAEYVAMVCTFVTFQARSAIREVGKVFDLPPPLLDRMARLIQGSTSEAAFQNVAQMAEFRDYLRSPLWQHFREQVEAIIGVPRHLSIHVGGMIIASCPIPDLVPLESARMPGRVVCQWDKDMIEEAGLIKIDLLGLGMLSVIRETIHWIREAHGISLDWNHIPQEDPRVYQMIGEADTVGVFQVESRAQTQHLPRTRPENLTELAIQVALIRPGPLQGNMVEPYIQRKQGHEPISYPHPKLEPILRETLGVILFQEQVLQVAVAIADYTPGQAEELRRALGKKRSKKALGELRGEFLKRAETQGIVSEEAAKVFGYLEGFAGYGFCKSHALSFAHLAYISGWLRVYYPAAFFAALLNNQPMGFYPLEVLVQDAKHQGIPIGVVDVNHSGARCHVEASEDGPCLRLGFSLVKGIGMAQSERIEQVRLEQGAYVSLRDFSQKTHLEIPKIERLIEAGAFDSLGLSRRELLWQLWILEQWPELSGQLVEPDLLPPRLPRLGDWDALMSEYRSMGFSARLHPMQILRKQFPDVHTSEQLLTFGSGIAVRVAGLVVGRQRPPTAKGFAFVTLEDEHGMMNVVVSPKLCEQDPVLFRLSPMMLVEGTLQKQDGVINVRAETLRKIHQRSSTVPLGTTPRMKMGKVTTVS